LVVLEITDSSTALDQFLKSFEKTNRVAIVVGNEKTGVLTETLENANHVVHIPMQ
jgi:tRNA G18 (ribose-2'-O)-methylase SpoU